ncbi:hypothetical protein PIB30_034197 [Stylosanthes scabra]|uniref:Uncharacterized protein n=1 Tax=Stylosanthes scabra TaxID=79078 RepID=A0ABU6RDD4_9FABA|nr:hypothetical protein [Stylosanthes scabra]
MTRVQYSIDIVESQRQGHFEVMFETLAQERAEIMGVQRKIDNHLRTIAKLASSVICHFVSSPPQCLEESQGAITLHSRTRLKEPIIEDSHNAPITPGNVDTQEDEVPIIEKEIARVTNS